MRCRNDIISYDHGVCLGELSDQVGTGSTTYTVDDSRGSLGERPLSANQYPQGAEHWGRTKVRVSPGDK